MTDHTLPFVSVIVPVLNGERTIRDCLLSLLRTDYPPDRREILVVDNGSTDSTAEIVKSFPVILLHEERQGAAAARNKGIEASRGEILAFTDTDCVVSTRWLRELVQGFEDDAIGGFEGEIVDYLPVTAIEQYIARRKSYSYQMRRHMSPLSPYAVTANVAFRREVFQRIGVFDPRFPTGEDVDFSWRFFNTGDLKLWYNPKAVVFHRHRSTVRGLLSQQINYGRGLALLQAKYPARLPWGWWQELWAWRSVVGLGWVAAQAALRLGLLGGEKIDAYDAYFTFLRKLSVRIGFLWETFAGSKR
jgi:GT2 family glycosyltransferase